MSRSLWELDVQYLPAPVSRESVEWDAKENLARLTDVELVLLNPENKTAKLVFSAPCAVTALAGAEHVLVALHDVIGWAQIGSSKVMKLDSFKLPDFDTLSPGFVGLHEMQRLLTKNATPNIVPGGEKTMIRHEMRTVAGPLYDLSLIEYKPVGDYLLTK